MKTKCLNRETKVTDVHFVKWPMNKEFYTNNGRNCIFVQFYSIDLIVSLIHQVMWVLSGLTKPKVQKVNFFLRSMDKFTILWMTSDTSLVCLLTKDLILVW